MTDPSHLQLHSRGRALRCVVIAGALILACGVPALAQGGSAPPTDLDTELKRLFIKSFDLFTVVLVLGSIVSVAVILQCVWEIRRKNILPETSVENISRLARFGRWSELRDLVTRTDKSLLARIVRAAMDSPGTDRTAIREAAELAAGEESARWFRKIEPLNIIGNLGPLLGLAGTVWGMIIAFTTLTAGGGQADPNSLAGGIAKALFHTLLGLLLAVPSLLTYGFYRTLVDKHCTRAMAAAGEIVELLPESPEARGVAVHAPQPGTPARPPQPARVGV